MSNFNLVKLLDAINISIDSEGLLHKRDATSDPTTTDDSVAGYSIGSRWINITSDEEFVCLDATASSAVWKSTTDASSGSGDVTGPGSSTDNAIARFDGATGKIIQNSSVTIDDSGNIATSGTVRIVTGKQN